jgi:hypothetical protein
MERIGIYATDDPTMHELIGRLLERKTGVNMDGCVMSHHAYIYYNGDYIHGTHENSECRYKYRLVTLEELWLMPDYPALKEMTVSEISKELGYEVKIVK